MFKRDENTRNLRASKGFTLVELLVVLSIFIALTALTVPSYLKSRPQRLLNGETNRIASIVRQGRLFSLRDNEKVYMEFIPELDMYRLWNAQGWKAYSDPIGAANEPVGWNPEIGDFDGDLDGDGDFWWGDGGTPESPTGTPEDIDVKPDGNGGWYYEDSDGTYTDPDVLLMPTYPGNQPIRTLSPKLRISLDSGDGSILNITRDFSDTASVGGDSIIPFEVDLRMRETTWDINNSALGKRNGVLSHFPLVFMVFFPDGTLAASWDDRDSTGFADEVTDISPGRLGATQIHLQARGEEFNPESYNLFDPNVVVAGDEGDGEPESPYNTLSVDDSASDAFGRVLTVNNLSGRIIIRNFAPKDIDVLRQAPSNTEYY